MINSYIKMISLLERDKKELKRKYYKSIFFKKFYKNQIEKNR